MNKLLAKIGLFVGAVSYMFVGVAAFAESTTNTTSTRGQIKREEVKLRIEDKKEDRRTTSTTSTPKNREVDLVCMQNASVKRDNGVIAIFDTYHSKSKLALEKRRDDLRSAWAIADRKTRREKIKEVWRTYRKSWMETARTYVKDKKSTWKTYYADRKACGAAGASDDGTTESVDNQL